MEKMNKPAWFELADNDQPAQVAPKTRKGGIFAVVTTLALTGVASWGFVSGEKFPAAEASTSSEVVESVTLNSISPIAPSINSVGSSTGNNPILPPSGNSNDDDDDDEDDDNDEEDDD